jgi:hypothetical protein
MTHVMFSPWKRTFTLTLLVLLIVYSPFEQGFFIKDHILAKNNLMKRMVI